MGKVYGSQEEVLQIELSVDTVYLRTNIKKIINEDFIGWEYDEEQIPKDDFIARIQQKYELLEREQTQTSTTLLELMEVVLIGGM